MTQKTAAITIASANYLPYVKTLMQSVKRTNPSYVRYLILADDKPDHEVVDGDLYKVIRSSDLSIQNFADMAIRYDVMEFNTAIKPFAIDWLLENTDADNIIYFDPDICIYRPLTELDELLSNGAAAVVTPHLTRPLEDGKNPDDYNMLQAGVFNLGFFATSRDPEAREFVKWWARRLKTQCHADFNRNLFTDQRWVDLAPCYIGRLSILRNTSYNVAYWNLPQRLVSNQQGKTLIDGRELAFFHFSGLDRGHASVVSKHQNRLRWADIRPLHKLFKDYRAKLDYNGWADSNRSIYTYNFAGNMAIHPVMRRLYCHLYPDSAINADLSAEFIEAMCNREICRLIDGEGVITALMMQIYRERPDLQRAFDLDSDEGKSAFHHWFGVSAKREFGFDDRVIDYREAGKLNDPRPELPPPHVKQPNADKPWYFRKWRKIRKWYLNRIPLNAN